MAKVENVLKENYRLKQELEETIRLIKDNEAKSNGLKIVQYAFLLSDSLKEVSDRPLKYFEEIFNVDRAVLFIKQGSYAVANGCVDPCERVFIRSNEVFSFTFLANKPFYGTNEAINLIHKDFRIYDNREGFSFLLVPIIENGNITGGLGFFSNDSERFADSNSYDFISELAVITSIALQKINDRYMLETKAQTDYLTGLPNKSMMELTAERWLARYHKYGMKFAFLLLDLDNFKCINDVLGHLVGDEVLKLVSRSIREHIGGDDLLGRYGGDEFYVFAEVDSREKILQLEENISKAVDEIAAKYDTPRRLNLCGGVVFIPEDEDTVQSFIEIVKCADERLYKAKESGKGKFCFRD